MKGHSFHTNTTKGNKQSDRDGWCVDLKQMFIFIYLFFGKSSPLLEKSIVLHIDTAISTGLQLSLQRERHLIISGW